MEMDQDHRNAVLPAGKLEETKPSIERIGASSPHFSRILKTTWEIEPAINQKRPTRVAIRFCEESEYRNERRSFS
jgi:hypothetical protein